MYVPKIYKAPSARHVQSFISRNGFATLTGNDEHGQLIATHVPLKLYVTDQEEYLLGHVARGNEIQSCFGKVQSVMAIFMNEHAYISSSWYEKINVPTWNYIAVHVHGSATIIEGQSLIDSLSDLVDQYENKRDNAFSIDKMPQDMLHRDIKGIVGFKINIHKVEAQFKLSQNRNDQDHANIIKMLEQQDDHLAHWIAQDMKAMRYGTDET